MYNAGEEVMLTVDSFGAVSVFIRVTAYRNTRVYLCLDLRRWYLWVALFYFDCHLFLWLLTAVRVIMPWTARFADKMYLA